MTTRTRLNIGAGDKPVPGFISVDIKTGTEAWKLPYADESVDEIYSSHCLEHVHHSMTGATLAEWRRVLKPGARLRVAVPDFDEIARRHATGEMSTLDYSVWLHGYHPDPHDRHRSHFGRNQLEDSLRAMGFDNIRPFTAEYDDCSKLSLSMNIECFKRQVLIKPTPKVVMFLSAPRFGPTDLYHGVVQLCAKMGWEMRSWGGDNWCKTLCVGIADAIRECDPDYIMTLDFDSCFQIDDVLPMLKFMQEHPEIAAVWPVQAHRHMFLPLGYAPQAGAMGWYNFSKDNPWAGEFTPYGSGHFGCTFIRRQVFDTLPQPWLMAVPNIKTGLWDAEATDNDISFWVNMQAHGFVFGQMNTCQIGHMELAIKWVGKGGQIIWQQIQHWKKHGKPKEAVFDGEDWNRFTREKMGLPPLEKAKPEDQKPPELPISPASPEASPELYLPSTNDVEALEALNRMALHDSLLDECNRLAAKREAESAARRELAHANGDGKA